MISGECSDSLSLLVGVRVPGEVFFGRRGRRVKVPSEAGVAQLVERRICNPQVTGSSPLASSRIGELSASDVLRVAYEFSRAGVAERSMAADCKSAGVTPTVVQIHPPAPSPTSGGSNSGVESQPSKLLVAGSNPVSRSRVRSRYERAHVAQQVEHVLGKDGVTSSSLVVGSRLSFEDARWAGHLAGTGRCGGSHKDRGRRRGNGQAEV